MSNEISEAARNLLDGFNETDLAEMLAAAQAELGKPTHPCTTCTRCHHRCACWWTTANYSPCCHTHAPSWPTPGVCSTCTHNAT
jgi:hypothetical protein